MMGKGLEVLSINRENWWPFILVARAFCFRLSQQLFLTEESSIIAIWSTPFDQRLVSWVWTHKEGLNALALLMACDQGSACICASRGV
jgi:hypothetical protein